MNARALVIQSGEPRHLHLVPTTPHDQRNAPDAEDFRPDALTCDSCGSQSVETRTITVCEATRGSYSGDSPAEFATVATCSDCAETWEPDAIDLQRAGVRL